MDPFLLLMFRVCRAFLSVLCSLVVTYWDRAGFLALVCDVFLFVFFCHFPMWSQGSSVVLDYVDS